MFRPDQFDIRNHCSGQISLTNLFCSIFFHLHELFEFHATFNNISVIRVLWKSVSCHFQQYFSYTCIVEISFMPLSTIFQLYMYYGNQFHVTFINISTIHVFQFYGNQFHATFNNNYCKNINIFIIEEQSTNYQMF